MLIILGVLVLFPLHLAVIPGLSSFLSPLNIRGWHVLSSSSSMREVLNSSRSIGFWYKKKYVIADLKDDVWLYFFNSRLSRLS